MLRELGELAAQFNIHGRSLAEAVELLEQSNRRAEESITNRHANIEALVSTLDARTDDFAQRLQRFSALLDELLDAATNARAADRRHRRRDQQRQRPARSSSSSNWCARRRRKSASAPARRSNAVYDEAAGQVQAMFQQSADRFTEIMQGMKQMAAEMQQELETTRAELRRGIFELPQETAESAAQMRRVIVDQIEALAELNRIVARHGRSLDTAEPVRREPEPAYAGFGAAAAQARPPRGDISTAPPSGSARRHHRCAAAPPRTAVAERRRRTQRRLAQRSVDPRLARGKPADRAGCTPANSARAARPQRENLDRSKRSRSTSRA